jgi:hypothetical protein
MIIARIALALVKMLIMAVATLMIIVQIPELRYDLASGEPVQITAADQLSPARYAGPTLAVVHGTPDFERAAIFAKHGVQFTYFLLEEYGTALVVRAPEPLTEEWKQIDRHVGRLRTYARMPFRRSIRAGFRSNFGVELPEDALFLARDDVPRLSGWAIGAAVFSTALWCILFYCLFIWHGTRIARRRPPRPHGRRSA